MSRSKLLAAALALPLMVAGASSAQANVIALVIDGSGSINSSEWTLQQQGYAQALTDLLKADGQNSIGVWQFSTNVNTAPGTFYGITTINTAADKTALINFILGMTQIGNNTAIGKGIETATNAINAFTGSTCKTGAYAGKCIIDVSTDGVENEGSDPTGKSATAFNSYGIRTNCIGIGGSANCNFNNGFGQDWLAADFNTFKTAITAKLSAELTPTPEPLTMSLFGAGLVGAAALRRRKAKTA